MSMLAEKERDALDASVLTLKENKVDLDLKIRKANRIMIISAVLAVIHLGLLVFNFIGVSCE
jgi:hypothetical protein